MRGGISVIFFCIVCNNFKFYILFKKGKREFCVKFKRMYSLYWRMVCYIFLKNEFINVLNELVMFIVKVF